jgi:hypothetical protein
VKETFGLNDDASAYVYLSDGGHFENLGLYEMIRRGCRHIVVLDSACDPNFSYSDLGNALLKIHIDMGVAIDFDEASNRNLQSQKQRWAVATIRYSTVNAALEDGVLVYVKPMMIGTEPPTVAAYRASHKDFPHESMGSRYDESQIESYRMLGLHTVQDMCAGWQGEDGLPGLLAWLTGTKARATSCG